MNPIRWLDNLKRETTEKDYVFNPKTEARLTKKITNLASAAGIVSFCITFPLYYMRDLLLPQFALNLADKIKYEVFFDRYLYLIDQGGLAFADRFFIAYALILAANSLTLPICIPIGCYVVRRDMKPINRVTTTMKKYVFLYAIILIMHALVILIMGTGADQTGFFRAHDSYTFVMLIIGGIGMPYTVIWGSLMIMKIVYVAYDAWRDGTFREVFLSKT